MQNEVGLAADRLRAERRGRDTALLAREDKSDE